MDLGGAVGTPGSTTKGRGRKAGTGGRGAGPGRGAGASTTPGKAGVAAAAAAPGAAPAAAAAGTGAAAAPGAGAAAAAGLGAAGGVVKKRGRAPKAKAAGDAHGVGAGDSGPEDAPDTSMPYRGTFTKDLSRLMYGFGDYENPIQETINVVEDILVEYVRETCCAALNEAARMGKLERERSSGASKLKVDEKDILFLVRKDPKKYARIRELLDMQLLIKEARKTLDVEKISETDLGDAAAAGGGAGGPAAPAEEDPGEELPDVPDEDIDVE